MVTPISEWPTTIAERAQGILPGKPFGIHQVGRGRLVAGVNEPGRTRCPPGLVAGSF